MKSTANSNDMNGLYVGSIETYLPKESAPVTSNTISKTNNLGSMSNQYSFSNISSIPREDAQSSGKQDEHVNVFTPTHTYNPKNGDTKPKFDDSSTDLLKKIN